MTQDKETCKIKKSQLFRGGIDNHLMWCPIVVHKKRMAGAILSIKREDPNPYFFVFFGVFAAVFFALPHGPFDLQAIPDLLV
jgi:hypothetical protein